MENGLTFRFEADDLKDLVNDLNSSHSDRVWVTFFLKVSKVVQDDGSQKFEAVMRAKAVALKGQENVPSSTSKTKFGCPVPPCTLIGDDEGCADLVQQILSDRLK